MQVPGIPNHRLLRLNRDRGFPERDSCRSSPGTTRDLVGRPVVEDTLFFGVKGQVEQSFGELPFYMQPYVKLRGAPAARFQGEGVASIEAELRWHFHPRWSALAFAGTEVTWSDRLLSDDADPTTTGGVGFRYLLAREHGLHMGIDVAHGEEGSAVYVQFGSAWMRF